jgi:hypothetical protein
MVDIFFNITEAVIWKLVDVISRKKPTSVTRTTRNQKRSKMFYYFILGGSMSELAKNIAPLRKLHRQSLFTDMCVWSTIF